MQNAEGSGVMRFFRRVWRIIRWPLAVLAVLYVVGILYELTQLPKRTAATVAAIHAQKLTMADVDGKHLPPVPDPKLVDATVEGIDANKNGIRDDVELAIFKKYPNDTKLRAAELQYAMTEQMYLSKVSSKETWKAVTEEDGRASSCIAQAYSRADLSVFLKTVEARRKEVEKFVFNTKERKDTEDAAYKFTTSVGDAPGISCDIDFNASLN